MDRGRDRERGRLVGSYPSHCSHVQPHLIGWFEVSLQEEDGRLDRPEGLILDRIMIHVRE